MSLTDDVSELLNGASSAPPAAKQRDDLTPWRTELSEYAIRMRNLHKEDPGDAMAWLSSVSARALEMMMATLQSDGRLATKFRIETLIPFRDECRFQFQVASRRQAVSEMEWKISTGYES